MQLLNNISRYLLGILLLVLGANGFLQFLPYPDLEPDAGAFMEAIASTGMIFPLLGLIEIASGILLLLKKAVPLALLMVLPILVNAVIFHLSLDQGGMLLAAICFVLTVFLIFQYKETYKALCH